MKRLKPLAALLALFGLAATAQTNYGLPAEIQEGNILHCFNWKLNDIKKELPNIAEAGFVAVQTSPMQRYCLAGVHWADLYRPADFVFSPGGLGTENQLKSLCEEAEKYGISIIVDVVFNHVDAGSNHSSWWNNDDRLRTGTKYINYSNRQSITEDRLGDYPDVNTENPDVIARAKAYIEQLKSFGVKGIRFDAAKHIALPSEGSDFWKEVTSVPGMFYYGEILDGAGGSNSSTLMKEYVTFMSVTDTSFSAGARRNQGVPTLSANWGGSMLDESRLIYWGESHDEYSNAGGASKNTAQEVIDKAYAILACRSKGVGLYFSRPAKKEYGDIKVGQKGSTHFIDPEVAEINKFKNAMVGKEHAYANGGTAGCVTRKDGGAVIVNKAGAGEVNVVNANGYCPAGTYVDRISGNTFTVTENAITGTVGSTGIAVIYNDIEGSGVTTIPDEEFNEAACEWYTLQGVRIAPTTEKGIYILRDNKGRSKKVLI